MNNALINHVKTMQGKKVLVAGDIMLDRFVYGSVDRISPESPVPVLVLQREDMMLGGAGNAVANLAGLGVSSLILSSIGDDEDGGRITELATRLGADTDGLLLDTSRPTTVKTRYLAGHQQLLRTDFEKKEALSDTMAASLLKKAKALINDADVVIISDYGKGLLRKDVVAGIIEAARSKKIPVVVDPKGHDFSIYKGASVITPNKKELSEATRGMKVSTNEEVIAAAEVLIKECGIDAVVATRSAEGMSVIQKDREPLHLRGADIEVFDVSGAGDTVIATLAAALASGASLEEAAQIANTAGGVVVAKVGTAPIRSKELIAVLENAEVQTSKTGNKHQADLCDWQDAGEQVRRWRTRGLKIGFTNGCFDILHKGHVSYLNDARAKCDRLIVALNCDTSVKILKGQDRPVHDEESRAAVLGALGAVDMVVLFGAEKKGDDNTAIELLELLQPDVYFKGGDYTIDQIPEAPTIKKNGGEVCIMPVYAGHSTTGSLKKIKISAV
jgi:D-beta-D-heptose 7-phosphate kinase/D-beta-D-heptose 1-phosphate adenosyltransferase